MNESRVDPHYDSFKGAISSTSYIQRLILQGAAAAGIHVPVLPCPFSTNDGLETTFVPMLL